MGPGGLSYENGKHRNPIYIWETPKISQKTSFNAKRERKNGREMGFKKPIAKY